MLFEPPTQVWREPDVQSPSVRTRKDIADGSACHGDTYCTPPRLLGSGKVSPLGASRLGRDDGYSSSRPSAEGARGETLSQRFAVSYRDDDLLRLVARVFQQRAVRLDLAFDEGGELLRPARRRHDAERRGRGDEGRVLGDFRHGRGDPVDDRIARILGSPHAVQLSDITLLQ